MPTPVLMTSRQRQVLDIIEPFQKTHGRSPTYREIGDALGLKVRAIQWHINSLVERGALRRKRYGSNLLYRNLKGRGKQACGALAHA